MSRAVDTIFGSKAKSKQGPTSGDIDKAIAFIRETTDRAREDVFNIFPKAARNRLEGARGAMDIFRQSIPEALNAFQLGNLGAQETNIAGLPQQIRALMGLPTDLSGLQTKQVPVDTSFITDAQLPDFNTDVTPAEEPQPNIQQLLANLNLGGF